MNDFATICSQIDSTLLTLAPYRAKLVLATKTVDRETLSQVSEKYPELCFGENRQQELCDKWFGSRDRWSFIGRLQRNKVKYIVDKVSTIESLDSLELAIEIERQASKRDLTVSALIEVNAGEEQKGGVERDKVIDLLVDIRKLEHIEVKGLMTVLPKEGAEQAAKEIGRLYKKLAPAFGWSVLSMGMSGDYELGLKYGANEVRIGSMIFGKRS